MLTGNMGATSLCWINKQMATCCICEENKICLARDTEMCINHHQSGEICGDCLDGILLSDSELQKCIGLERPQK